MPKKRKIRTGPRGGKYFRKKRRDGKGTRKVYTSQRKRK